MTRTFSPEEQSILDNLGAGKFIICPGDDRRQKLEDRFGKGATTHFETLVKEGHIAVDLKQSSHGKEYYTYSIARA